MEIRGFSDVCVCVCQSVTYLFCPSQTVVCVCQERLFRIAGKPFRHCNKVSFISPEGAFRIVKQAFRTPECKARTCCFVKAGLYVRFLCLFVTFIPACYFLFRKFQLSKFFTSEMNIYAVLCMTKGNRKSYLQPESDTMRHSYSVLMPV